MDIANILDEVTKWLDARTSYVVEEDIVEWDRGYAFARYFPVDYRLQNEAFQWEEQLEQKYPNYSISFGYDGDDVLTLTIQ